MGDWFGRLVVPIFTAYYHGQNRKTFKLAVLNYLDKYILNNGTWLHIIFPTLKVVYTIFPELN